MTRWDAVLCLGLVATLPGAAAAPAGPAVEALRRIGPGVEAAIPALCESLATIGPGAAAALPALRQHLQDPSPFVRDCAARAIARIQAR